MVEAWRFIAPKGYNDSGENQELLHGFEVLSEILSFLDTSRQCSILGVQLFKSLVNQADIIFWFWFAAEEVLDQQCCQERDRD
jgi:hypothetical protein